MNNDLYIKNEYNVVEIVEELSSDIEEDYLLLANKFKELFKELENGYKSANLMLRIDATNIEDDTIKNEVNIIVEDVKNIVNESSAYFMEMNDKDILLYSNIEDNIKQLNVLKERIEDIKEDTIDLEVLSINAMTVAIKAGIDGRGFSFITDELKKLSSTTISYTTELSKKGNKIIKMFTDFQKGIRNLRNFQEEFYSTFNSNLDKGFNNFSTILIKIEEMVLVVVEKAQLVSKPIFKIMDEIQLQDIIKQSLEHVIMSLKEIQSERKKDEDTINKYAVVEILSEISINLLSDVESKIMNCFTTYKSNFALLREILENIEDEKQKFIKNAKDSKINDILKGSTKVIDDLAKNIENTLNKKNDLSGNLKSVNKDIDKLTKYFKKYFEIIDRFYCIEIVSRIEVAKRETLRKRKEIINKMGELTIKIEKDIKEAMKDIEKSDERSKMIVEEYFNSNRLEFSVAKDFVNKIKQTEATLLNYNERLQNSIGNFTPYSDNFFYILEEAENNIKKLFERANQIAKTKNMLYDLNNDASKRKRELLKYNKIEKWEIKDDRIIDIINKFTILTHKQLAGNIVGVEVEKGDEAGELTLF